MLWCPQTHCCPYVFFLLFVFLICLLDIIRSKLCSLHNILNSKRCTDYILSKIIYQFKSVISKISNFATHINTKFIIPNIFAKKLTNAGKSKPLCLPVMEQYFTNHGRKFCRFVTYARQCRTMFVKNDKVRKSILRISGRLCITLEANLEKLVQRWQKISRSSYAQLRDGRN